MDKWNAAVATGQPYENVERVRRADGEYRWFLSRAAPLRDDSGKIIKAGCEISDPKPAKAMLRRLGINSPPCYERFGPLRRSFQQL